MGLCSQNRTDKRLQSKRDNSQFDQSRTSHYGDKVRIMAEDIGSQVANMNSNTLKVDVREFYFYQRIKSGRICSCFLGEQATPEGKCQICFGTGFVGGYNKYGTKLEVIDVTSKMNTVGIEPDYTINIRPVLLKLMDNRYKGYFVSTIKINNNTGDIDAFQIITSGVNRDASIEVLVKGSHQNDSDYRKATLENVKSLISFSSLDFKVIFERVNLKTETPRFSHIYLRYKQKENLIIRGDIPKTTTSFSLGEQGFLDQFTSIRVFFDNTITNYTSDDFFYLTRTSDPMQRFWKIFGVELHNSFGATLHSDVDITVIQSFEMYTKVPI